MFYMENSSGQIPRKPDYKFRKEERLRSKKVIEKLFAEGRSFLVYPYKVVYLNIGSEDNHPVKAAFAVSKKLYKKAVQRNLIKRRMREAYRLNKHELLSDSHSIRKAIMFIYVGKEIFSFHFMEKAMVRALHRVRKQAAQNP